VGILFVMGLETMTENALLDQVRSQRKLPSAARRRRIREDAGVSLRQLAAAVGDISHMGVARWEAGATPASPEHVAAYGRILRKLERLLEEG
jgi:hypothetical protein